MLHVFKMSYFVLIIYFVKDIKGKYKIQSDAFRAVLFDTPTTVFQIIALLKSWGLPCINLLKYPIEIDFQYNAVNFIGVPDSDFALGDTRVMKT